VLRSVAVRRWIKWAMVGVLLASVATWWITRDRLPDPIRIATAMPGGQYHRLAGLLGRRLSEATGRDVDLIETAGSVENSRQLLAGRVDLAILQAGAAPLGDLAVLAPLHADVIHVVVRRRAGLSSLAELAGRRVAIGAPGSGMHESALSVLEHYGLAGGEAELVESYFLSLLEDESLDAAIVTTGLLNGDLERLLATGRFELLPLDADAIGTRLAFYRPMSVPRGLYSERPTIPSTTVLTVGTTALLVGTSETSPLLVSATLDALYHPSVRESLPTLIRRGEARGWTDTPLHPEAADYLNPFRGLGTVASFMESLAAAKELLFALAAGLYLAWTRWSGLRQAEQEALLRAQKEKLDAFVSKTLSIERAQMSETDPERLRTYLDDVTRIKLEALEELSHEDLRGDRMFLIFLTQCAALSAKIQAKYESSR
jgi:TRAP transporter TAXI family solute receptor